MLLPVFNGGEWLELALKSMLGQTLSEFELIIIDDGSTDQTGRVIENARRNDSRIRSDYLPRSGIAVALNHGLAMVRSEILARMDADDVARPQRLQKQLTFLEQNPKVAALGSWACIIDSLGHKIGELRPEAAPAALQRILEKQNPFIHSSMMMVADLVRRVGGYRPVLEGAEDYDLWLRLSDYALLANVPEFLIDYRYHPTSVSAAASHKQLLAARLARQSARARWAARHDFVERLSAPLSLAALRSDEDLRGTADLYHLLGQSAGEAIQIRELFIFWQTDLNHAERKAAQAWLKDLLGGAQAWNVRLMAFLTLLYLHPLRGLALIWSNLQRGRFS